MKSLSSRVGGKPILLPEGVSVQPIPGEEKSFQVGGPLGKARLTIPDNFCLEVLEDKIRLLPKEGQGAEAGLLRDWGTFRQRIFNLVTGVKTMFRKDLKLVGVGYRVLEARKDLLKLKLGFSHDVEYRCPYEGVIFKSDAPDAISVMGVSKENVGEVAANISRLRASEPYKGKGVHIVGKYIIRKEGKKK